MHIKLKHSTNCSLILKRGKVNCIYASCSLKKKNICSTPGDKPWLSWAVRAIPCKINVSRPKFNSCQKDDIAEDSWKGLISQKSQLKTNKHTHSGFQTNKHKPYLNNQKIRTKVWRDALLGTHERVLGCLIIQKDISEDPMLHPLIVLTLETVCTPEIASKAKKVFSGQQKISSLLTSSSNQ